MTLGPSSMTRNAPEGACSDAQESDPKPLRMLIELRDVSHDAVQERENRVGRVLFGSG